MVVWWLRWLIYLRFRLRTHIIHVHVCPRHLVIWRAIQFINLSRIVYVSAWCWQRILSLTKLWCLEQILLMHSWRLCHHSRIRLVHSRIRLAHSWRRLVHSWRRIASLTHTTTIVMIAALVAQIGGHSLHWCLVNHLILIAHILVICLHRRIISVIADAVLCKFLQCQICDFVKEPIDIIIYGGLVRIRRPGDGLRKLRS